jgi:putative SOS response-associated peptidase YedK
MCGRYGLYDISESELLTENKGYTFTPNYNVAPTQSMPVITENEGKPAVKIMQWGINRKLGKDIEKDIFNTRSEKALERFWSKTVRSRRCIVPANGFYEWKNGEDGKTPYWIHSPNNKLIYFAGIYDVDADGNEHYSIMTTSPNDEMSQLHDRMPVILDGQAREAWLQSDDVADELLGELLRPLPDNSLEMFEVSKDVNFVRNNSDELILPRNPA